MRLAFICIVSVHVVSQDLASLIGVHEAFNPCNDGFKYNHGRGECEVEFKIVSPSTF